MSGIGAALTIPKSALDAIDKAEKRLKDIQNTADNTATSVTASFKNMAVSTDPFIKALDQIIAKLGTINASASNVGNGLGNLGQGLGNMGSGASKAVQDLNTLISQLSNIGGNGTGGIMQAVLAFKRLQEAAKGASGMNIAELKSEIKDIEKTLTDTNAQLTKADQDALIKRKKSLQDELKMQQQMYEERVVSFQKALDKMMSAEQAYNNKQKRMYADRSKEYQNRHYQQNTTYQGALDFSSKANTLNRQAKAIEYLKAARMKLSQADADYENKLKTLNNAIDRHTEKLKSAIGMTQKMAEQTSYMSGYISRWAQRMAFAFSVASVKGFVEQMAEVRGQFELSQRSLEAILQNKPKADEIFNKTVELAVKSPFRIKDLVDYTRQLSAYRIESDKLYDTTKRLADVSAGLGVDMGRLILAYGQVKAAAYLRGSEVRQFTEAGINMYGELQQYFKEVKGEAYTTAQIVDMISKRKVTFEDVEAIFQRMTDKGGTFYNMQEIQAETLQGKISNLKDAFDVMLNEIGKSNEGAFKGMISGATELLENWEKILQVVKYIAELLIVIKVRSMLANSTMAVSFARLAAIKNVSGIGKAGLYVSQVFSQIGSAAAAAGKAIKGSLPTMILFGAIEAFMAINKSVKEYRDNIQKAADAYTKSVNIIDKSKRNYALAVSVDGEKGKEKRTDEIKKFIDEIEKQGYSVNIPIDFGNAKDADKTFNELTGKYEKFNKDIMEMNAIRAQNIKDHLGPGEDIDEDLQDYEDSYNAIIANTSTWENALEKVKLNYKYLSEDAKRAVDNVGNKEAYKSDVEYLENVFRALQKASHGFSTFGIQSKEVKDQINMSMDAARGAIEGFYTGTFDKYRENKEEVINETKQLFSVLEKYVNDPKEIMLRINRFAADNDYSETKKMLLTHLAEDKFNIRLSADTNSVQKTIDYIDKTVQAFVDSKTYKISIDVSDLKDPLEEWKEYFNNLEKNQKALKESDEWLRRIMSKGKDKKGLFSADENMFTDDELNLIGVKRKPKMYGVWAKEQSNEIKLSASQLEKIAKERLKAVGDVFTNWDWETKDDKKNAKKNAKAYAKAQRDLLQERISLLKDMNSEYQQLINIEGKEQAVSDVRKHFALAAKNVGMKIDDFIPDRKTTAKKIEEFASKYKDLTKRSSAYKDAAKIRIDIDEEFFKQKLDDAKNNAQEAFSKLDLFKKLKEEGLSDRAIKDMFGNLTSSFDEVRKKITSDFEDKFGKDYSKWGKGAKDEYASQMESLDKKVYQDQVSQAQELIKAYKEQLSDQLQLDKWYIEEKEKIQNNANIAKNPELQTQLQENLDKQYRQKTDANTWKSFQNSDMYVRLFDNLDHVSTKVLDAMAKRLQDLRKNLKDLDPAQLKAIAEQINKVNEVRNSRNPFKSLIGSLKEMSKARKELKANGGIDKYIDLIQKNDANEKELKAENEIVKALQDKYDKIVNAFGAQSDIAIAANKELSIHKKDVAKLKAKKKAYEEQIDKYGEVITKEEEAKVTFAKSIDDISAIVSSLQSVFDSLNVSLGMSSQALSGTFSAIQGVLTTAKGIKNGDIAGTVSGIAGIIGGLATIFNDESKIDKEIERQERAINALQNAYEKLKKSMDDAFTTERLYKYNQKSIETLEKEKDAYQAMINAEKSRKKPDQSKLQEYDQQIAAIDDTIKELKETLTEELGGFGSQANYKSAAEAFAEAWVDAFNEGSDALDALNKKFDEYIQNLIAKQATQRVVGKLLEPLLKKIDDAVSEGSEGGNKGLDLTRNELEEIKKLGGETTSTINSTLSSLAEVLGWKPSGSSNISALQQGIQSVTESTAQALESILSSVRYYVATQQSDIRIIRDTLLERLGSAISSVQQDSTSNPVLVELRLQTTILTDIRDTLSSCVKQGHKLGSKGVKVFMN